MSLLDLSSFTYKLILYIVAASSETRIANFHEFVRLIIYPKSESYREDISGRGISPEFLKRSRPEFRNTFENAVRWEWLPEAEWEFWYNESEHGGLPRFETLWGVIDMLNDLRDLAIRQGRFYAIRVDSALEKPT